MWGWHTFLINCGFISIRLNHYIQLTPCCYTKSASTSSLKMSVILFYLSVYHLVIYAKPMDLPVVSRMYCLPINWGSSYTFEYKWSVSKNELLTLTITRVRTKHTHIELFDQAPNLSFFENLLQKYKKKFKCKNAFGK